MLCNKDTTILPSGGLGKNYCRASSVLNVLSADDIRRVVQGEVP